MSRFSFAMALAALSLASAGCGQHPTAPVERVAEARNTAAMSAQGGRAGSAGTVYVTSQDLYYDTFVTRDPLPMAGLFQQIEDGTTEFGPGDPGYLGGRWWEDTNGNDVQDETDHYFLCPLLGPGRTSP